MPTRSLSNQALLDSVRLCVLLTQERCSIPLLEAANILIDLDIGMLQLREKNLPDRQIVELSDELSRMTRNRPTLFMVNDRPDIGLICRADGVHVGQEDMPVNSVRALADQIDYEEFLIGLSTHSLEQASAATRLETNYIAFGPIFPTATKGYTEGVGLEALRSAADSTDKPVIAIGGVTADNVRDVMDAGAQGVAVCSAIIGAKDIRRAALDMLEMMGD